MRGRGRKVFGAIADELVKSVANKKNDLKKVELTKWRR